jgi:two-component system NtrC family sensor kinase
MRKRSMHGAGRGLVGLGAADVAAPVGDGVRPSSPERTADLVPSAWLDRLLVAVVGLPLPSGERAVAEALVRASADILPAHAVGACVVLEPGVNGRGRVVVRTLPEGAVDRPGGSDPTRIFPEFAHEHVVRVPSDPSGSTIHVASDDDDFDADSAAVRLIARVAMILGHALPNARAAAAAAAGANQKTRRLEVGMIQAEKLATFGQLAAGLVHELNNPLTSIVAYSDFLLRQAVEGDGARDAADVERLRRISESANRMLRFTRELVTYARPSTEATGAVVVHEVIDQAIAFCEHVLAAAGMRAERRYGPEVVMVRGVSEQLVQVFVNLLTNACQAAPPSDGQVLLTISMRESEGLRRAVVAVSDNGAGIAPEHLSQVFVPFFTTRRHNHGTGLGLSIVKSIVETHDGEIRVESEVGRGTRFVVELPADRRT